MLAWLNKDAIVFLSSSYLVTLLGSLTQLHKSLLFSFVLIRRHVSCGFYVQFVAWAFFNQMIQVGLSLEVWLGFSFSKKNMSLIELSQQRLMLPMIIMWQFCLSILFFTNTRRHNNASGFICIKNMGVIVSTGKAEMSLIPNSMMRS